MNWIESLAHYHQENQAFVLVTILETKGSTPRDVDAKMVVGLQNIHDTIGGGQLEFDATNFSRELLSKRQRCSVSKAYNLSKDLEQCCGGQVTLLFECFPNTEFDIVLFGAGHVGHALIKILAQLPCRVSWIDSRAECFDDNPPSNVRAHVMQHPEQAVDSCVPGSWYLVMTHDHAMDQQICEAILSRGDSQFCGLIGSKSKIASFRGRFKRKGFSEAELEQLTAPIGLKGINGKSPMEIAVSTVAQLLQLKDQAKL